MISLILPILSACRRQRLPVVGATLCLGALSAVTATRVSFDTDVLSLLPRTGQAIPAFREYVARFGSLDELYVVFTAPEGHAISEYDEAIGSWAERLRRIPEVSRVDTGLTDRSHDIGWLADRQLLLLGSDTLTMVLRRLQGDGMREALASRRSLLVVPSASVADLVRHDPLGLSELLRDRLAGTPLDVGATGEYMTADSRSRLLIVHPTRPPYDTEFSRALFAAIDRAEIDLGRSKAISDNELPPLRLEIVGGHRIAVETESVVRRESISNTVISLALILPLLFAVFRSPWLVAVGPVPAGLSLVMVLGALGLAGATLSAAATASAAMLFGLGADGVVLLYVAHTLAVRQHPDAATSVHHLGRPAISMLIGMWTTAATFYGLAVVDFPSLEQLGLLIGHSMVVCGLLTLILVPALLPGRAASTSARSLSMPGLAATVLRHRSLIVGIAVFFTIGLGLAALWVRINPTLDRLRAATPGAEAFDRIARQFGLPQDVYVVLQQGNNLEALLAFNEHLTAAVSERLGSINFRPASALLPSASAQERRADIVRQARLSPAGVAADLELSARMEGFHPDSLAPFRERLPELLSPDQRVTYDGYVQHGLSDLVGRFVRRHHDRWFVVSYAFPSAGAEVAALESLISELGGEAIVTGLPLVNRELARRFLPQFGKGLALGSVVVLALIVAAFRNWRLSLLSLAPAVMGLIWAAGVLSLARIELDLFAVFAVVTFVGIGVDYGIHLVHRYRDCGDVATAVAELAPVILVAAAITAFGYGTLVGSSYPPLRSMGLVSIVAIVMLTVASVLVLPALLASLQRTRTIRG